MEAPKEQKGVGRYRLSTPDITSKAPEIGTYEQPYIRCERQKRTVEVKFI